MQGGGLMKTEKHSKQQGLGKETRGSRQVHFVVKCFNFPFSFLSVITGIEVKPEEVTRFERCILFIAFITLGWGLGRIIYTLLFSNGL